MPGSGEASDATCDAQLTEVGAMFDAVLEAPPPACESDADCEFTYPGAQCGPLCGVAAHTSQVEALAEATANAKVVCEAYAAADCPPVVVASCTPASARCIDGTCGSSQG